MDIKVNVLPDLPSTAIQIAATLILFFVLRHFLWKPVKEMLEKRAMFVKSNIQQSEIAKEESLKLKADYEQKLQEAKNEASKIISDARTYSEDLKAKAIKESKDEARKEYEKGLSALELEKKKVMASVQDEIVDLAMLTAQKVLNNQADQKLDRDLVSEFVGTLEADNE